MRGDRLPESDQRTACHRFPIVRRSISPLELRESPRQESNLHAWLRRPLLCPLSYEGKVPRVGPATGPELIENGKRCETAAVMSVEWQGLEP